MDLKTVVYMEERTSKAIRLMGGFYKWENI